MGCDIHLYIEAENQDEDWIDSYGQIYPGRNYEMFSLLAGVRCYDNNLHLFEARGIPKNLGYWTIGDYYLIVREDEDKKAPVEASGEGCCWRSTAEKWVKDGWAKWEDIERKKRVNNPDWHTPSYLYKDELATVIKKYKATQKHNPVAYNGILGFMRAIERSSHKKLKSRIVFWFDN